jgi:hypothetical protein
VNSSPPDVGSITSATRNDPHRLIANHPTLGDDSAFSAPVISWAPFVRSIWRHQKGGIPVQCGNSHQNQWWVN